MPCASSGLNGYTVIWPLIEGSGIFCCAVIAIKMCAWMWRPVLAKGLVFIPSDKAYVCNGHVCFFPLPASSLLGWTDRSGRYIPGQQHWVRSACLHKKYPITFAAGPLAPSLEPSKSFTCGSHYGPKHKSKPKTGVLKVDPEQLT